MFLTSGTLPLFASIAERHPRLTLIIDHMGLSREVWRDKKARTPTVIDQAVSLAKYQTSASRCRRDRGGR